MNCFSLPKFSNNIYKASIFLSQRKLDMFGHREQDNWEEDTKELTMLRRYKALGQVLARDWSEHAKAGSTRPAVYWIKVFPSPFLPGLLFLHLPPLMRWLWTSGETIILALTSHHIRWEPETAECSKARFLGSKWMAAHHQQHSLMFMQWFRKLWGWHFSAEISVRC